MTNFLKTFLLLGILSVILVTLGGFFGGRDGIYMAFFFSLLMNGGMYFFSDKLALSSLYIGDPLGGWGGKMLHLFSTHPPVEERIKRLKKI